MSNDIINFRFVGIELVFKSVEEMPLNGVGPQFFFDLRVDIKVHAELKLVIPFVTIKIRGGEEPVELAKIGVSCLFEIEDFENVLLMNEHGLYVVPPALEATIKPVAVSTARGVMYSEFRGTYLNNAVLPVIYMQSLIEEKALEENITKEPT